MARNDEMVRIDGDRVRARRQALGITQADAAAAAGISHSTWQVIELGKRPSSTRTAAKVDAALDRLEAGATAPASLTMSEVERLSDRLDAVQAEQESQRAILERIELLVLRREVGR